MLLLLSCLGSLFREGARRRRKKKKKRRGERREEQKKLDAPRRLFSAAKRRGKKEKRNNFTLSFRRPPSFSFVFVSSHNQASPWLPPLLRASVSIWAPRTREWSGDWGLGGGGSWKRGREGGLGESKTMVPPPASIKKTLEALDVRFPLLTPFCAFYRTKSHP